MREDLCDLHPEKKNQKKADNSAEVMLLLFLFP